MIPRHLLEKADALLDKYPLLAITGPRKSGKTTLAKQLRPDFQYVNLELDENRAFALADPHGFLQTYQVAAKEAVELFLIYGGDPPQPRSDLSVLPWKDAGQVF